MKLSLAAGLVSLFTVAIAGPNGYGVCQSGCAGVAVSCYSAAGVTFGTVAAVAAPPAVASCNTAFGGCQAKCAMVLLAPTPS